MVFAQIHLDVYKEFGFEIVLVPKAMDAYWRQRIDNLLDEVEQGPTPLLKEHWDELMTEMYGDSEELKTGCLCSWGF